MRNKLTQDESKSFNSLRMIIQRRRQKGLLKGFTNSPEIARWFVSFFDFQEKKIYAEDLEKILVGSNTTLHYGLNKLVEANLVHVRKERFGHQKSHIFIKCDTKTWSKIKEIKDEVNKETRIFMGEATIQDLAFLVREIDRDYIGDDYVNRLRSYIRNQNDEIKQLKKSNADLIRSNSELAQIMSKRFSDEEIGEINNKNNTLKLLTNLDLNG